jgi:flagellar biosynthetic protein FliR
VTESINQLGQNQLVGFVLVLARVGPLFVLAPMFSSKMIPPRARGVIAVALTIGIAPLAIGDQAIPNQALEIAGLALKELLIGIAFAFTLAVLFAAVTSAGALLDTLTGFSFGAVVDPMSGVQSGPLVQVYSLVAVAVFIAIGGDAWVIQGLARTYEIVPLLATPSLTALVAGAVETFSGIFAAALEVAAPVVLALVLTDVAFGVVSRVVPQLNVFAVGFPVKIVVGLLVVGVSLPFAAGWLSDELAVSVESALRSLEAV